MCLEKGSINRTQKKQCLADSLISLPCFPMVLLMFMTFLTFQKPFLSRQMIRVPLCFYDLLQITFLCINTDVQQSAKSKEERTSTVYFVSLCYVLPLLLV